MEELDLHQTHWDICVVGNGVSALWLSHWFWSSRKSVLWISSEDLHGPARALLRHGWLWGAERQLASSVTRSLAGAATDEALNEFETIYFDARSSKRFRRLNEVKKEWGAHEKEYFEGLQNRQAGLADLWDWHEKLYRFLEGGQGHGPLQVELFKEPRFVRVQGWPLHELKTSDRRISGAVIAGMKPGQENEITASQFILGDYDEPLASLIQNAELAEQLSSALKGRTYRAGFGLQLWHKELQSYPMQTAVVPLVVNPGEKGASHVAGRLVKTDRGLESYWIGLLTDEELEDNNEILKKIKQAKRALERAIPGFGESIQREAVTFEPRMVALDLVKKRKREILGAGLISDYQGVEPAIESLARIMGVDTAGEKNA